MEHSEKKTLTVKNLIYRAKNNEKHADSNYITLLKNVSCTFTSGNIYAIMGPSGSCKTTFLNTVCGYVPLSDLTSGSITYNGKERDESWFNEFGLVEQDDPQPKKVTVIDYIRSEYLYRVSSSISKQAIEDKIEEILKLLEIKRIANRNISVISGGERKRTMIAVELVCDANVLILDEPTSGLDSNLALKLVTRLKEYAVKKNKIVLFTVHQPGSGLFGIFENLLFFYKGALLYNGPISEVEKAFATMGLVNNTTLSISEFLFEVFSETNILENGEELSKITENLVISEEMKNQAVYAAANIKRGGYRLFAGGFSFRGLYLNFKELITNDFKYWPFGLKFVKDLVLLIFFFCVAGYAINEDVKKIKENRSNDLEIIMPEFSTVWQLWTWLFSIYTSALFSGSFIFQDIDTMSRRMKRKKYSIFTAICSGLLYNYPLFVLGLVLNYVVIRIVYRHHDLDTKVITPDVVFAVIYTFIMPIVQLFFSALSLNFFTYLLGVITKTYLVAFHSDNVIVDSMLGDPDQYLIVGQVEKKSFLLKRLVAFAYKTLDKGLFSVLFPYKHFVISKFSYYLDQMQKHKENSSKLNATLFGSLEQGDNETNDAFQKYFVAEAINAIYKMLTYIFLRFKGYDKKLLETLAKAKNLDEFFYGLKSEGIKKVMHLYLGKYFSMCYLGFTLILLLVLSTYIIHRRFAPELRYKL
ncbi:hypothetical protein ENBRE01_1767 [Enteropsectra breve]|nr:hypothetical protein ENBRE01_1767 [Enteropsectra breve]